MANARVMNVKGMGDSELTDLFEIAFREQITPETNLDTFEVEVKRTAISDKLEFEVEISGMAGTASIDDFKNNKVPKARKLTISRADKGSVELHLVPSKTVYLNGNDYLITYSN